MWRFLNKLARSFLLFYFILFFGLKCEKQSCVRNDLHRFCPSGWAALTLFLSALSVPVTLSFSFPCPQPLAACPPLEQAVGGGGVLVLSSLIEGQSPHPSAAAPQISEQLLRRGWVVFSGR